LRLSFLGWGDFSIAGRLRILEVSFLLLLSTARSSERSRVFLTNSVDYEVSPEFIIIWSAFILILAVMYLIV
jgi:hypothetical protein